MRRLIVSAPFGNYLGEGWATRTLGTFTLHPRPPGTEDNPAKGGRLRQVFRTVRYNPLKRSWRNKIGLRNPGILGLHMKPAEYIQDKIISVHGFDQEEWEQVLYHAVMLKPKAVEINVSCPNVTQHSIDEMMYAVEVGTKLLDEKSIIVKVGPVNYEQVIEAAYDRDVRMFHLCNTIPTEKGGVSGKPLKPLSLSAVSYARGRYGNGITIIGGGGVTSERDVYDYVRAGADHVAIASALFFPWNWLRFRRMAQNVEKLWLLELDQEF